MPINRQVRTGDLAAVDRFGATLGSVSWFAAAGEPLIEPEIAEARDYLAVLGLGAMNVASAGNWATAKRIARDPAWDARWWQAEERLRKSLLDDLARAGEIDLVMAALTRVTDAATRVVLGAASVAAARQGVADPALTRAAAGAATQACYQAALALAAGAKNDHPFAIKYRLFAAGRWPLGVVRGEFYLL